jgi:putative ABC transport system permease protein
MATLFAGAVVGLYFQPPALKAFFGATGLAPGGGTATPIATAPTPAPAAPAVPDGVVALGRLRPAGDLITLAPPYGAGDARIAALMVAEGDRVEAGAVVALLDNLPQLEAAAAAARSSHGVAEAALAQTRAAVEASRREAAATRDRAAAALHLAERELARQRDLHDRVVVSTAALDRAETALAEAAGEHARAAAALSRYEAGPDGRQPDVLLAERSLAAAAAELASAEGDLAKGRVVAPVEGTILAINARIGERPGAGGVATLGDTASMIAELEVYQTDIRHVAPGQPVEVTAPALGDAPLSGTVARIGLEVGRQALVADDPAAHTDARVVEVAVALDAEGSARAAGLTGLEVVGRIATGGPCHRRRPVTRLLTRLFGRLPIGWLQLTHNRGRMAAAVAGVAFANVLVFVQLGLLAALNGTIVAAYGLVTPDVLISAADANTLTDGSPLSRRHLYGALAVDGVADAAPLYLGQLDWTRPDGSTAALQVYGLPPEAERFAAPALAARLADLRSQDAALLDERTRGLAPGALGALSPEAPLRFEVNGVALSGVGTVALGGGFSADGALVVSDQTFLRLFPRRTAGTPSHLLVATAPGADPAAVAAAIAARLGDAPVKVRPLDAAVAADLRYQTTQRPTGVIFGFGVFIGLLVGIVVVYQVLATDVADHLREYATFKAMGYRHAFFLGVVFEEALVLALFGFVPGVVLATAIYGVLAQATGLPVAMEVGRALAVLVGTVAACAVSGAIATRRLAAADPAELF